MKHEKRGVTKQPFDWDESFMVRIAGIRDEVLICKAMREMLIASREFFSITPVTREDYVLLEQAMYCLEKSFCGHVCKELFDVYCELGTILMELGHEELGIACLYLHHTYRNRAISGWPPSKAWHCGRGGELVNMLPINDGGFQDFEADTMRESAYLVI